MRPLNGLELTCVLSLLEVPEHATVPDYCSRSLGRDEGEHARVFPEEDSFGDGDASDGLEIPGTPEYEYT